MSSSGMFKPGDFAVLAVIVAVSWLWWSSADPQGGAPEKLRVVSPAGEDTLDLSRDTVITRGAVRIEIRQGQAAITESDCPTRQCVSTGWLNGTGEMSACMPNGVFIEMLGEDSITDAVSY